MRQREFVHELSAPRSVKDLVEALGVPHTEIDVILVNGESVGFGHPVSAGERISVYPVFEALDVAPLVRLRPEPLRDLKFVVDGHLGKLAAYLRLLGFDTLWSSDPSDAQLAEVSAAQRRVLLTRDRGLLKRTEVTHGGLIHSKEPREQLSEVVARFDLRRAARPFSRCLRCNTPLEPVPEESVADRMPPGVRGLYDEVFRCAGCDRVYWKGTHWHRMQALLARVLG